MKVGWFSVLFWKIQNMKDTGQLAQVVDIRGGSRIFGSMVQIRWAGLGLCNLTNFSEIRHENEVIKAQKGVHAQEGVHLNPLWILHWTSTADSEIWLLSAVTNYGCL